MTLSRQPERRAATVAGRPAVTRFLGGCLVLSASALAGCASSVARPDLVYFPPPPAPPRVLHLVSFNALDTLPRRGAGWSQRPAGGGAFVASPMGLAYRDDHLYICDTELRVVHDWDLEQGIATRLGTSGDGRLATPVAVAVDDAGCVFVADTGRGEVVAFDAAGAFRSATRPSGRDPYRPVALATATGVLYAADVAASRIDVYATTDLRLVRSLSLSAAEEGVLPMGVSVGDAGRLFVADMLGGRVLVLDPVGNLLTTISQRGERYGDLGRPRHLVVAPDGVLFIADAEFAHLHLFDPQGRLLMLFGGPDDKPGDTPMPVGVAMAERLPERLASLVPANFAAHYFLFVSNGVGSRRLGLFAVGEGR